MVRTYTIASLMMLLLTSCFYSEVSDEDIVPDISDVAGCWVSTKNISVQKIDHSTWEYVSVTPTSTCKEICIDRDRTFSIVSVIQGAGEYDQTRKIVGSFDVENVDEVGAGKSVWIMHWSSDNEAEIRLVDGTLYGVSLVVSDLYYATEEGERKYSRTKDEHFCDAFLSDGGAK